MMRDDLQRVAKEGGLVTASLLTYFATTRKLSFCNIGNPPPLVFREALRRWEAMHGTLGNSQQLDPHSDAFNEIEYRHGSTILEIDDLVVLYGNGVANATFPTGNVVGHSSMLQALNESAHACQDSRIDHLKSLILSGDSLDEDMTFVTCKATSTNVSMTDNLLSPLRLFQKPRTNIMLAEN